jgi:hypothetical protein
LSSGAVFGADDRYFGKLENWKIGKGCEGYEGLEPLE